MANFSEIKYEKLKEAVLQFEKQFISIDEVYSLINRITFSDKKRHFGFNRDSRFNSRLRYNRFMIRMLEKRGILSPTELMQVWKINKNIGELKI